MPIIVGEEQEETGGIRTVEYAVLPEIDQPSMSARFRICTARQDHQGDIIEPSGVDWEDYRFNPVVKFEHGFSGIPFPVARSADDSGVLHEEWIGEEDAIYARAFFSDKYELSEQCFGLIVDGFMRGASIHVMPRDGMVKSLGDEKHHVYSSNQMEWSVATVAINPDAYAKSLSADSKLSEVLALQLESANRILERGTVGDRRLLPSLAKCLKSVQPPKQAIARGHSTTERDDMGKKSLTQEQVDKLGAVGLAKALASGSEYDSDSLKRVTAKAKSLDLTKADEKQYEDPLAKADNPDGTPDTSGNDPAVSSDGTVPDATPADMTPSNSSPGADFLSALHSSISDLCDNLDSVEQFTEKPEVQDLASQVCDSLRSELTTLEGAFSSIYPDQPPLSSSDQPADAEMVKSWVHNNAKAGYQLAGLATRLSHAMKNPSKAKSAINATIRDLKLLGAQAKSWKPAASEQAVTREEFSQLVSSVDKLVDQIASQPAPV